LRTQTVTGNTNKISQNRIPCHSLNFPESGKPAKIWGISQERSPTPKNFGVAKTQFFVHSKKMKIERKIQGGTLPQAPKFELLDFNSAFLNRQSVKFDFSVQSAVLTLRRVCVSKLQD